MQSKNYYSDCTLCPRNCHRNRSAGEKGVCGMTDRITAARAALHYWEEPCISGEAGSGTVFFSGCSLHCTYCQNREISAGYGREITSDRLAEIFTELQGQGANNINLVTPTHYMPSVSEAVIMARSRGLMIPVVYNTGGYENAWCIRELKGTADIFLTDFKYMDTSVAQRFSSAPDYPGKAAEALAEMVSIAGPPVFDDCGLMRSGVIVRHLVLPGYTENTEAVLKYVHETFGDDVVLSIMNQYTPLGTAPDPPGSLNEEEYDRIIDYAISIGIEDAFIQESGSVSESFIPPFDLTGIRENPGLCPVHEKG